MSSLKKILVIDDDKKFSLGLVALLRREGFEVINADNGIEGMAAIRSSKPDMILCDIMMPPPNGIQLKKELANDPQLGQIPFFFLTARAAQVDKLAGFQSGADDYITKPFDINELLARIRAVVRQEERGHTRGIRDSIADLAKLRVAISANLSHEVHTSLTVIISSLELILKDKFVQDNVGLGEYISTASSSSSDRLKFLVEDLQMLHDIDHGSLNSMGQRIDFSFHLKNPINQTLLPWEKKKLNIQISINPLTEIFAPRIEFGHVLAHLVDNACKFSPEMGKVHISVQPGEQGGSIIEITNDGFGIPPKLREKVFERYYQISQGTDGLGVGLPCKHHTLHEPQGQLL